MLRRIVTGSFLTCALVTFGLISTAGVSAHSASIPPVMIHSHVSLKNVSLSKMQPQSCGYQEVPGTTVDAKGSTSANVSMSLFVDCNNNYYASANSFRDSNGFAFTGHVDIEDATGYWYPATSCPSSGICDSLHVSSVIAITYVTNDGWFYSVNGIPTTTQGFGENNL